MTFSKLIYKIILCVWIVGVSVATLICSISNAFVISILPVGIAGLVTVLLLPLLYKVTRRPIGYAVIITVLVHLVSYVTTCFLAAEKPNESIFWVSLIATVISIGVNLVQVVIVFKPKSIIPTIGIVLAGFALLAVVVCVKHIFFPTTWHYCDMMIIGESQEEIIEEYGEFDKIFYFMDSDRISYAGYYLYEKSNVPYYYMISFDDTGKAISTAIDGGWGG